MHGPGRGQARPSTCGEDEIEVGIGIHGEPGRRRVPLASAREIAELLVDARSSTTSTFTGGDGVLAFVNGLGGTPLIELYLMYGEVATLLEKAGVSVARSLVGSYITSLDMAGCSVTLLKLDDELLPAVGRPRADPGAAVGAVSMAGDVDVDGLVRWMQPVRRTRRRATGTS